MWVTYVWGCCSWFGRLKGIRERLLMLEVQMLFLVWGFASSLLETVAFLMDFRESLIKGFPAFD